MKIFQPMLFVGLGGTGGLVGAELERRLRAELCGWLPPVNGEPEVTPLHNGAGQLPTVGRAALFATLRYGLAPVLEPLLQAIDAIAKSAGDLSELGGGRVSGCDVFV